MLAARQDTERKAASQGNLTCVQTGLDAAKEVGRGLKGQLQEAQRDCSALQSALREEEAEAEALRGSLAEQQARAASLEGDLATTEVRI